MGIGSILRRMNWTCCWLTASTQQLIKDPIYGAWRLLDHRTARRDILLQMVATCPTLTFWLCYTAICYYWQICHFRQNLACHYSLSNQGHSRVFRPTKYRFLSCFKWSLEKESRPQKRHVPVAPNPMGQSIHRLNKTLNSQLPYRHHCQGVHAKSRKSVHLRLPNRLIRRGHSIYQLLVSAPMPLLTRTRPSFPVLGLQRTTLQF